MENSRKPKPLFSALIRMKCPRCREGNVFTSQNPFYLRKIGNMNHLCPVCHLNFRPEPGFYFGGAIVSYPIMVAFNVLVTIVYYLITGSLFDHFFSLMTTFLIGNLIMAPAVFRYSRIIFLYFNIRYRSDYHVFLKNE